MQHDHPIDDQNDHLQDDHFDHLTDISQFGCMSKSLDDTCTKLTDLFFRSFDDSDVYSYIVFLDFVKAFDLVNHNVLLRKFLQCIFPPYSTVQSMSFLQERSQYVSLNSCNSPCLTLRAGMP